MKKLKWIVVVLGVFGLIGVRVLEDRLFYDPFLAYFHDANIHAPFPDLDWGKLVVDYLLRFGLNTFFSVIIIQFIFLKKQWTIQALVMLLLVFAVTFPVYLLCIKDKFEIGYLFSFYVRRFVIQPILILLIVPLFYYRRFQEKSA